MASNPYTLVDSGKESAAFQMEQDALLLEGVERAVLRFFEFTRGAITYGYFIDPTKWLKEPVTNSARRPSGGGLIFHGTDLSFTIALPIEHPLVQKPALERYHAINSQVALAIESLLPKASCTLLDVEVSDGIDELCMANPTVYDIMYNGKKVGGSSQRKTKRAFIHQCSLFISPPCWNEISEKLLEPERVLPLFKAHTGSLLLDEVEGFRESLKAAMIERFNF